MENQLWSGVAPQNSQDIILFTGKYDPDFIYLSRNRLFVKIKYFCQGGNTLTEMAMHCGSPRSDEIFWWALRPIFTFHNTSCIPNATDMFKRRSLRAGEGGGPSLRAGSHFSLL
jgi:hypothetical protein